MISSILFFLFLFSSIFLFPFPLVLFVCLSFRRSVTAVWEIEHDSRSRPRFQITVSLEFNKPVASIEKWATWCYQDDLNRSDTLSYRSMFFLCLYTHDHSFFLSLLHSDQGYRCNLLEEDWSSLSLPLSFSFFGKIMEKNIVHSRLRAFDVEY